MFMIDEDIDHPSLTTLFGTPSPCWRMTADSNALRLFASEKAASTVGVPLTGQQAGEVRSMTGANSSLAMEVPILGHHMKLHLVGRRIDAWEWGGTAAHFGDTAAVTRDLENSLSFAEQIVAEVNSLVVILDSLGRIKRFNRLCEETTGMREADLVGRNAHELFMPADVRDASREAIQGFFQREHAYEVIRPIQTRKGVRMIHWRNKIMHSGSGPDEVYLVCSGTDVTEEQQAKAKLVELASKDVLTGLPNRHAVEQTISAAIAEAPDAPFSLMFLDLDNFKRINDHYGHATGDALIVQVAIAIGAVLGPGETVARLGGDEFLVIVPGGELATAQATAQRILERMKEPFALTRAEVYSAVSMGIAQYPGHGTSMGELVRSADTAMYTAKEAGRHTCRVFHPDMNKKVSEFVWLDSNARKALDEGQFQLYYQPKVSLATGRVEGVEALVRWNHPERGLIAPANFIPYCEESGLIVPLGRWVMAEAAKQAGIWKRANLNLRIAVNLSARQLHAPNLLEEFVAAILTNDISPSMVDLELTESSVIEDEKQAHRLMRMLREHGARIYLDDFGTGYSSLSQLARLPLDALKLDGSFIKSIHKDAKAQSLVRSMVAVGQELNLKIIAECVETEEQAAFLRSINVDVAQGYLYGKPMCLADFMAWMPVSKNKVLQLVA